MIKTVDPKKVSTQEFHSYLLGAVAPRPIAFASTVDKNGVVNLSPFSFFNAFSANPPILIFSPARRVRNNTTKHTLENVLEHKEVVINIVNYAMVEQMSLASTEYDKGVNEFTKAGLTEVPSKMVKPPRVAEAPVAFECKVNDVVALGKEGGAGNLIIAEVVLAHINEEILDESAKIDPFKLDAVGRLGGNWYTRANYDALFEIPKPLATKGIGIDQIPQEIRNSSILTGNNLGRLGNVETLPDKEEIKSFIQTNQHVQEVLSKKDKTEITLSLHKYAKKLLDENQNTALAWKVLMAISYY